ncbi:DUF1360 domain-containing protein [Streptomyces sp. NPDC093248]|uniref:DUF1360 domain-containing protein n=1 Tax=Streptomyces sp. NPDC093248 TaxID=3155072 RepID=UPI003418A9CE
MSRLLTRERITSFLRAPFTRGADEGEAGEVLNGDSRGTGTRRAVGDLPRCPYRASARVARAPMCSRAASPRPARPGRQGGRRAGGGQPAAVRVDVDPADGRGLSRPHSRLPGRRS